MSVSSDVSIYPTKEVKGLDLNHTDVLVGDSGGLSAIYNNQPSSVMGAQAVETEHGILYLDPDEYYSVLDPYGEEGDDEG